MFSKYWGLTSIPAPDQKHVQGRKEKKKKRQLIFCLPFLLIVIQEVLDLFVYFLALVVVVFVCFHFFLYEIKKDYDLLFQSSMFSSILVLIKITLPNWLGTLQHLLSHVISFKGLRGRLKMKLHQSVWCTVTIFDHTPRAKSTVDIKNQISTEAIYIFQRQILKQASFSGVKKDGTYTLSSPSLSQLPTQMKTIKSI